MCAQRNNQRTIEPRRRGRDGLALRGLRQLRLRAGLTQEELAHWGMREGLRSMSRATVVCAECGDNVGPATAQLLADKLSLKLGKPVSVSDLIGNESSERDRDAMSP